MSLLIAIALTSYNAFSATKTIMTKHRQVAFACGCLFYITAGDLLTFFTGINTTFFVSFFCLFNLLIILYIYKVLNICAVIAITFV